MKEPTTTPFKSGEIIKKGPLMWGESVFSEVLKYRLMMTKRMQMESGERKREVDGEGFSFEQLQDLLNR